MTNDNRKTAPTKFVNKAINKSDCSIQQQPRKNGRTPSSHPLEKKNFHSYQHLLLNSIKPDGIKQGVTVKPYHHIGIKKSDFLEQKKTAFS